MLHMRKEKQVSRCFYMKIGRKRKPERWRNTLTSAGWVREEGGRPLRYRGELLPHGTQRPMEDRVERGGEGRGWGREENGGMDGPEEDGKDDKQLSFLFSKNTSSRLEFPFMQMLV